MVPNLIREKHQSEAGCSSLQGAVYFGLHSVKLSCLCRKGLALQNITLLV